MNDGIATQWDTQYQQGHEDGGGKESSDNRVLKRQDVNASIGGGELLSVKDVCSSKKKNRYPLTKEVCPQVRVWREKERWVVCQTGGDLLL